MKTSGPLFLGFRMLFGSRAGKKVKRHLIGAILGVGFSLIPLILVIEVSGGMIEGITRRFIEIGSYHLQLKSYSDYDEEEIDGTLARIEEVEEVERAFEAVFGEGLIYSPTGRTGVSIRGLPEDFYERDGKVQEFLSFEEGSFDLSAGRNALVSGEVARKLEVSVGDTVRLLTAKTMPGRSPVLRPSTFTVAGVFSTGYYELDALSMYLHVEQGKRLFNTPSDRVIAVKTDDPYQNIEKTAGRIQSAMPPDWYVYTWYGMERAMLESFKTTRNLLIFIMIIIVIVASFNISSSMIMLVLEKEPEIAILKSTGVHPKDIVYSFLSTGVFIGLTGMLIGITAGLALAVNINPLIDGLETVINTAAGAWGSFFDPEAGGFEGITVFDENYYLEEIPIRLRFIEIFGAGVFTLLVTSAAAYFPARRAGSIRPLDILRKH
ncbi:MAG: ABC transporter permease [Spirochaetaceae bacterium]